MASDSKERSPVRQFRVSAGVSVVTAVFTVFLGISPAFGLWLPWAKEEDKVKKTVTDVWNALVSNDEAVLRQLVAGATAPQFVDQKRKEIKELGVKHYECRFNQITIDPSHGTLAWVAYDKIATVTDGSQQTTPAVSVLSFLGGQWRMLAEIKNKREMARKEQRKQDKAAEQQEKLYGPLPETNPNYLFQQAGGDTQ